MLPRPKENSVMSQTMKGMKSMDSHFNRIIIGNKNLMIKSDLPKTKLQQWVWLGLLLKGAGMSVVSR